MYHRVMIITKKRILYLDGDAFVSSHTNATMITSMIHIKSNKWN